MKKLLLSIGFLSLLTAGLYAAPTDRFKVFSHYYSTQSARDFIGYPAGTEYHHDDFIVTGGMYVMPSTTSITNVVDNDEDPIDYAQVALESNSSYPIKIYEGDLQVVTTGYGITFPDGSLQVTAGIGSAFNTLSSTGTIVINSDSDDSGDESIYFRTDGATQRMFINGSDGEFILENNVGISAKNTAGSVGNLIERTSGDIVYVGHTFDNPLIMQTGQGYMAFHTSSTERIRITVDGNVGIGTNNPSEILEVESTDTGNKILGRFQSSPTSGNYGALVLAGSGQEAILGNVYNSTPANQYCFYQVGGDTLGSGINVRKGGNVGIGATNPTYKLEVNGTIGYSSAQTRYLIVSPSAFVPSIDTNSYQRDSSDGLLQNRTLGINYRYFADVNLPHNATVTNLTLYYSRFNGSQSIGIDLRRVSLSTASGSSMADVTGTNTGYSNQTDSSITNPTIDNNNYSYYLRVDMTTATNLLYCLLYGAKITYTVTEPLP
jgi:hypothetical protein